MMTIAVKRYVVCEPGGGIFQGEFLGLVLCYSGPQSDLPIDEICYFDTRQQAEDFIAYAINSARSSKSASVPIIEKMWVAEVNGDTDMEALAQQAHATAVEGVN